MRFVILHYHIFKNAGSTIENILDRNFGERFARFEGSDRNGRIDAASLIDFLNRNNEVEALSSHQIVYPMPCAPGFLFFDVCFLRDPIDRVRSIYDYARVKPAEGDPISDLANQLGFPEFVRYLLDHMPQWVSDVQIGLLGGNFEQASRQALRTSFLGVVDQWEESVFAGKHVLRPVFPQFDCDEPPTNVSSGMEGTLEERKRRVQELCGPELYAELVDRNAGDLRLVDFARREVERRFKRFQAEESVSFHLPAHGVDRS